MALTKITRGVIKPNENYDTHNINSTGIITATQFHGDGSNLTGLADPSVLTVGGATKVEAVSTGAVVTGILTATQFSGDGSNLSGVGGIGDGLGSSNNLNYLFTSPELLALTQSTTISATQAQGKVVFTASDSIRIGTGVTVEVAAGTTVKTDILSLFEPESTVVTTLSNIVEDTTPQLGGNLDLNGNNITGTGNIPAANLTGNLPAIDGSALTGITTSQVSKTTANGFNRIGVTTNTSSSFTNGAIEFRTDNGTTSETRWIIAPQGGLIPTTNDAYDLGSAEYKVRDIYEANPSDARLKTDVVDYTGGLAFVESLRVVDFTWKEDVDVKAGKRETGLIAQEVKEALDASNYNSWRLHTDGDTQGVDKNQLIPALISAVQELTEEVRDLRSQVQRLENE